MKEVIPMNSNESLREQPEALPGEIIARFEQSRPKIQQEIVLALVGNGWPRDEIAAELGISSADVKRLSKDKKPPPKAKVFGLTIPMFPREEAPADRGVKTKDLKRVSKERAFRVPGHERIYHVDKNAYYRHLSSVRHRSRSSLSEQARTMAVPFLDVQIAAYRDEYSRRKNAVAKAPDSATQPTTNKNTSQRRHY